nr:hypothetical protein [Tanacetum cinerariifolium]
GRARIVVAAIAAATAGGQERAERHQANCIFHDSSLPHAAAIHMHDTVVMRIDRSSWSHDAIVDKLTISRIVTRK